MVITLILNSLAFQYLKQIYKEKPRVIFVDYRFIVKHWYETPAMLPLFVFTLIENYTVVGAAARSIRLIISTNSPIF